MYSLSLFAIFSIADAIILHGTFQSKSRLGEIANTLKNSSINVTIKTELLSLFEVISTAKDLQENLHGYENKRNWIFAGYWHRVIDSVKETLLNDDIIEETAIYDISYESSKDDQLSKHQYLIDETLSFIESHFGIERSLIVITDKSDFSRVSLTRIVQKCSETKRKIAAFQMISEKTSKQEIENLLQGDLFIVDCDGTIATRMLQIARDAGFTGYTDGVSWVFTQRTTDTLKLSCSLPEGRYFGVQADLKKADANFILDTFEKCQTANDRECKLAKHRFKKVRFMQLWAKHRQSLGREWVEFDYKSKSKMLAIEDQANPFFLRLRIAVANTFHPWVTIVDFDKTNEKQPYCGLYGKYGYRYDKRTGKRTVPICAYGLTIDIIRYLEDKHEIIGDIHMSRDGLYGGYNESSGKATGLVAEILNDDADIAVDLMEVASRRKVIEFTKPYEVSYHGIAYLKGRQRTEANVFGPFSGLLWAVIMSVITGFVFLMWALERFSPFVQIQRNKRSSNDNDHIFGIPESMEYIWGMFCCGEIIREKPVATGSRVTAIFISFVFIMIVAVYSANLITSFVVVDETPLITGLSDSKVLSNDSKLAIGAVKGSMTLLYLESNPDMRVRYMTKSKRMKIFDTVKEGILAFKNRKIDLMMLEKHSLRQEAAIDKDCSMVVINANSHFASLGFSFKKGSKWKRKLEIAAQSFVNSGERDRLFKYWFGSATCRKTNKFHTIGVQHVVQLFFLVSCCAFGCLAIMLVALLWKAVSDMCKKKEPAVTLKSHNSLYSM